MNRWILIADASRARLFREHPARTPYQLIEAFDHPDSRARARDLTSDANGRKPVGPSAGGAYGARSVSLGAHGRVGVAPDTEPKEVEAQKFARELADRLAHARAQNAFDEVVIVCPPHFLGVVRGALDGQVSKHVAAWIDKDLTRERDADVERHVRDALQPR